MLTLREATELAEINLGQVLIPISAFGYSYSKLEKIFNESVRFFEKYYPLEKELVAPVSSTGLYIPDAIEVVSMRYTYGQFKKSIPKMDSKMYDFNSSTKVLTSEVYLTGRINYLAHYTVGNLDIKDSVCRRIVSGETETEFTLQGHFKKSSLKVELFEGEFMDTLFSVNYLMFPEDLFIATNQGKSFYTGMKVQVKSSKILPTPLNVDTVYYVFKISDSVIKLAESSADLENNIFVNFTDNGEMLGSFFLYKIPFFLTEDIDSYDEFKSLVDFSDTPDNLTVDDNMFLNRVETGTPVKFRTTDTFPTTDPQIDEDEEYYLIKFEDENRIQIALTPTEALLGEGIEITAATGVGELTIYTKNIEKEFIHCYGDLGKMEINLDSCDAVFYNTFGKQGDLRASFVSKYLSIEELSAGYQYNDFFFDVFRQKFLNGLGRQKATVKLDGIPVDITADNLITAQAEYNQLVKEHTTTRSKYWLFS